MKRYLLLTLAASMICALASVTAFADKVKKDRVILAFDVSVNGTLLKAGNYEVRFNQTTGELAFVKDGKAMAKTTARMETRNDKVKDTQIRTRMNGNTAELIGVSFGGSKEDVVVTAEGKAVTGG